MRTRALAMLAFAGSLLTVPSAHAAGDARLVVRGARSGYVDVTFPAAFALDPYDFQEVSRKGTVAGFFAERRGQAYADGSDHFAVFRFGKGDTLATARDSKIDPAASATTGITYAAGTYRIHIVADGPFEIDIPVTSGLSKDIVATPKHATPKARLFGPVKGTRSEGDVTWTARERVTIPARRTTALSVSVVLWNAAGAHNDTLCFAAPEADCPPASPSGQAGTGNGSRGSGDLLAGPGTLKPGMPDAVQQVETVPPSMFSAMYGWALVFDTPA